MGLFKLPINASLTLNDQPFAGDNVWISYAVQDGTDQNHREIVALCKGIAIPMTEGEENYIILEIDPDIERALKDELSDPDMIIPHRFVYGPVHFSTHPQKGCVNEGVELGMLEGNDFCIKIMDQDGCYLDPISVFIIFKQYELWSLVPEQENPLLPSSWSPDYPFAICAPEPVASGQPYWKIEGGSQKRKIQGVSRESTRIVYMPLVSSGIPQRLPAQYFSFLSSDTIKVSVGNVGTPYPCLQIVDTTSDLDTRAALYNAEINGPASTFQFVPNETIPPHHPPYSSESAQNPDKNRRLRYQLWLGDGMTGIEISQDDRDLIRQEYIFHALNVTSTSDPLPPPPPARAGLCKGGISTDYFPISVFQVDNDYFRVSLDDYYNFPEEWTLYADEQSRVANYVAVKYWERLKINPQDPDPSPSDRIVKDLELLKYANPELQITVGWRNPESNERMGAKIDSPYQSGRAIGLAPKAGGSVKPYAFHLLCEACGDFIDALASEEPGKCSNLRIIIEDDNSRELYKMQVGQSRTYRAGADYIEVFGSAPVNDLEINLAKALKKTSEEGLGLKLAVRVAWNINVQDRAPNLPETLEYPPLEDSTGESVNLILLGGVERRTEDMPFTHIAASIKRFLMKNDLLANGQPRNVKVVEQVTNPVKFLECLGVFGKLTYQIHRFFYVGHGTPASLMLLNDVPPEPGMKTHYEDLAVKELLLAVYGDAVTLSYPAYKEWIDDRQRWKWSYAGSENDLTDFSTTLLRVSNLMMLPKPFKDNIRNAFKDSTESLLLGCRTNVSFYFVKKLGGDYEVDEESSLGSITQHIANTIGKDVRGANGYCMLFSKKKGDEEEWKFRDDIRYKPSLKSAESDFSEGPLKDSVCILFPAEKDTQKPGDWARVTRVSILNSEFPTLEPNILEIYKLVEPVSSKLGYDSFSKCIPREIK